MPKYPLYKQQDTMDCGPTCLRMVAKFYGKSISQQTLRDKTQIGKGGVNLLGISDAAESIGFRTHAMQLSYDTLVSDIKLPAILHWKQQHFVVLYKVKKRKLTIADPGASVVDVSEIDFKRDWISNVINGEDTGVALTLDPSPLFYVQDDNLEDQERGITKIFKYLSPYRKLVLQLILGLCAASLLQLIFPFLTQSVVDTGINTGNIEFVYVILFAQLALFAGRLTIDFIRGWILLHISTRVNLSILNDFLIKLMKLPVSYFDSKQTGDILQRMNDHKRIESFMTGSSLNVLFSFFNLIILSVVLAFFNTSIFLIFAISASLYVLWVFFFLQKRKVLDYKKFNMSAKDQGVTIQLIQGMQEIKLNGIEKEMRWTWERIQAKIFKLSIASLNLNQWQQAGAFFINEGKNIIITFISAKAVIDGEMTLGTMLAVQYIIGQLNSPIEQMIGFLQSWQNAKISMDRLNEVHRLEDEEPANRFFDNELPPVFTRQIVGGKAGNRVDTLKYSLENERNFHEPHENPEPQVGGITLENLSFTYPGAGNEPVLKDITLEIPIGKTTAIVGVSGSGKTTLLKLLLKFYQPQTGEIRLNHTLLSTISHKVWRKHCGVVLQESFIFSDTIAKNIAVGDERPNMQRIKNAATIANVSEFIEALPLHYNTKIGMEGTGVSMGQKQRILIARAVYRDPDFMFFDEATNSLDANNESVILRNLASFFKGRTVVVIAHRLSTVKNADQIIVLKKGCISEKGTHEELVKLKGEYFSLVKNQLELVN